MVLLAVASVSSTDYLYAYGNTEGTEHLGAEDDLLGLKGQSGYINSLFGENSVGVCKTDELKDVKFWVKNHTACSVIDVVDYYFDMSLRIVIDKGPHEGETGWISVTDFQSPVPGRQK
jgi:hypothetical protein